MPSSLLMTDGYKLSMAEAGWPLRRETFYLSHRKGGLQLLPCDVAAFVKALVPKVAPNDFELLAALGYEVGAGVKAGLSQGALEIRALPKGAWFFDREPICTVTGTSALVSWLEPLALMLNYRVQVATLAVGEPEKLAEAVRVVTCEAQRQIVLETLEAVKVPAPVVRVESGQYQERVRQAGRALVALVGEPGRIFEVGLRAATCVEQHLLALEALKDVGIHRTSHVYGAERLGLIAVGTMGHEHVQRYGSDAAAFRAMVDRRPQRSSFLLDTFDTMRSGLPAAFALMGERRGQGDSIRYDSGDKEAQLRHAVALSNELGLEPVHILEDGFDDAQTARFETVRRELGVPPERQVYGYGGHLIARTTGSALTRDRVSAVYKLTQTALTPVMKFGDEQGGGKQSVPGVPVVFRRGAGASGPFGLIGQAGERPPPGYIVLSGATEGGAERPAPPEPVKVALSEATAALVSECQGRRHG